MALTTPRRLFLDLDGVIVDFDAYAKRLALTGEQVKQRPNAYLAMDPLPGALDAVRSTIGMGFDVWIASKPPTGIAHAYAAKAEWVMTYLPELKRKIILTHDKGLLGGPDDILVDDRPHKANCTQFQGTLIPFVSWPETLAALSQFQGGSRVADSHP